MKNRIIWEEYGFNVNGWKKIEFQPSIEFLFGITFFATDRKLNQWKILVLLIFFQFLIFETFFDFQPCMYVIGTPVEDDGIFNAKLSETSTSSTSTTTTSNFESISIFFHVNDVAKSFKSCPIACVS